MEQKTEKAATFSAALGFAKEDVKMFILTI